MKRSVSQGFREFAAVVVLAAAASAQATWYVDAGQPTCPGSGTAADPFCTIGSAVAAASAGDTIQVAPGSYPESVVIDKDALTLLGAGADTTTIVGNPASAAVGPPGFLELSSFTIEGFRIRTSDPGPGFVIGIRANATNAPGALWNIRRCVVEDVDIGIWVNGSFGGAQIRIEDTVVTRCGTGIDVFGQGIAVRNCTLSDIDGVGIYSGLSGSAFEVSDTIIASTGAWAIQRYWGSGIGVTIERVLVHDNNQENPEACVSCGPFVMYLAEGFPGGFGVYSNFTPMPGPVLFEDPLFVDAGSGDVRLQGESPAIDTGDPAAVFDLAAPYDLLGFGHLRVDDGNFDGLERADIGAVEFGGLLTNAGLDASMSVGAAFTLTQSGKPGALYAAFAGLAGAPLDLGAKGTLFLHPSPLLFLTSGLLPVGGTATVLAGTLPPAAAGFVVVFQSVQKGPGSGDGLHWTNAEQLAVLP